MYQWKKGIASRVASGELICSVVTFVRNVNYDPGDPNSALFTEHAITVRNAMPLVLRPASKTTSQLHLPEFNLVLITTTTVLEQGRAASAGPVPSGAESESGAAGVNNLTGPGSSALPLVAAESSAQGVRASMEDESVILLDMNAVLEEDPSAIGLEQSAAYFGVFDGHGGKAASHFSAKHLHFNIGRSAGWNRSSAARGSHGSHRQSISPGSDTDVDTDLAMAWDSSKARERDMIAGIAEGFLVRSMACPILDFPTKCPWSKFAYHRVALIVMYRVHRANRRRMHNF